jgi:hypothetical protein
MDLQCPHLASSRLSTIPCSVPKQGTVQLCVHVYIINSAVSNSKYKANGKPLVNNMLEDSGVW